MKYRMKFWMCAPCSVELLLLTSRGFGYVCPARIFSLLCQMEKCLKYLVGFWEK